MRNIKVKLSIKLLILKTKVVWLTMVAGYQRLIGSNVYVKYVLIAIPSLLLFGAYFVSLYYSNTQIIDLKVANISSGSATITWVTKDTTKTAVYVKEDSKFWPLEYLFRTKYIDDRDIDTSDNKRTTHFVTISDLSPDTNYYFKIGTSRVHVYSTNVLAFETKPVSDNFESPNPIYGSVNFHKENLAIADTGDSIIYVLPETGSGDEEYYATLVNSDDNWVINSPVDEGSIELQVVTDGEIVASKQIDTSVESLADVQNIDLAVDGARDNLASTSGTRFDIHKIDDGNNFSFYCDGIFTNSPSGCYQSIIYNYKSDEGFTPKQYVNCYLESHCKEDDLAAFGVCKPKSDAIDWKMWLHCYEDIPPTMVPGETYPSLLRNHNNHMINCKETVPSCDTLGYDNECGLSPSDAFNGECEKTNRKSDCVPTSTCNFAEGDCKSTYQSQVYKRYCKDDVEPTNTSVPTIQPTITGIPSLTPAPTVRPTITVVPSPTPSTIPGDYNLTINVIFPTENKTHNLASYKLGLEYSINISGQPFTDNYIIELSNGCNLSDAVCNASKRNENTHLSGADFIIDGIEHKGNIKLTLIGKDTKLDCFNKSDEFTVTKNEIDKSIIISLALDRSFVECNVSDGIIIPTIPPVELGAYIKPVPDGYMIFAYGTYIWMEQCIKGLIMDIMTGMGHFPLYH